MTNEIKTYIENAIFYINYSRRIAIKMLSSKDFSENEYKLRVERYITMAVMIEDLVKIVGLKLVKDEQGFYSVV